MISEKLQKLKPSATLALSSRAKELKAQGQDVVNLCAGEPSWDAYESIKENLIREIQKGCSSYSPSAGQPALKKALVEEINRHLNLDYTIDQVTVSVGAKFILCSALQALLNKGDEVLIPAPYWVSYPSIVELVDEKPVIIETDLKTHKLTPKKLQESITSRTRALILNSPCNPTSAMYSLDEFKSLGEVLKNFKNVFILTDDIYNRLIFEKSGYAPHLLEVCPDLKDRVVVINSASKNYALPGWRLGWAFGDPTLIKAMSSYQSQTVSSTVTAGQLALVSAFKNCEDDLQKVNQVLIQKRNLVTELLKDISGIEFDSPQGAFYIWMNVEKILGKDCKGKSVDSSMKVAQILAQDYALFMVPGEEFGRGGYLRFYFATSDALLKKCATRIREFVSELR